MYKSSPGTWFGYIKSNAMLTQVMFSQPEQEIYAMNLIHKLGSFGRAQFILATSHNMRIKQRINSWQSSEVQNTSL